MPERPPEPSSTPGTDRRPAAPPTPHRLADPVGIVGIGASAGGLEALERLLAAVPAHSGLAWLIVQHLDPTHKAMLAELLQRATAMPVQVAAESQRIRPDSVYVIPPNSEMTVADGALHLALPAQPRGRRLPIDVLLCSLARAEGARAIGVVLSGMGNDGTIGLQAIETQGGLTLAQDPASAQFDSMPRSAIDAGAAAIVALPEELPQRILRALRLRGGPPPGAAAPSDNAQPPALAAILALLHARSKHDLSAYKPTTLARRIERRMGVHGLATMADYAHFLASNPQETDLLFKEMLIGVTGFFRDAAVWQALKERVLPALLARGPGQHLRAWVAGCSTGEEAYTLAMLFREAMDAAPEPAGHALTIFASDLSADAIAQARRGRYAAKAVADMSPERLKRFFTAQGEDFAIAREIRECVLFAQHDVILDPPFTRLDILCCRNLMIYFNAALQRRLLPLFHYSLRPGGVLVLGGSESVGRSHALFTPLDPAARIYRRCEQAAAVGAVDFPVHRPPQATPATSIAEESNMKSLPPHLPNQASLQASTQAPNLQALADRMMLREFSPPAVLVNAVGDVLYIAGSTGKYIEPAAGKANWNIHAMARPAIRVQLAAALRQAALEGKTVDLSGLRPDEASPRTLDISVRPVREPQALAGMLLIVFQERQPLPASRGRPRRPAVDGALAQALEEIEALRREMGASAEELQAAIEELQSANEELQSANEELTTSKEEAQSTNEELQTVNSELQSKLDDLELAQNDMANLLNSTDIATLFLDNALNVRRYTDRIARIVHLRPGDIGRPLSDLASTLVYPQMHADAVETLRSLVFSEKQISTTDGLWFSVRIMPYRTLANVIRGVVITFVDITAAKELESRLRKA